MADRGFAKPWLHRSHPNLFIICCITLVRQWWAAFNGLTQPHLFDVPSNKYVNQAASPKVWAIGVFVSAALMTVGMFRRTFTMTRVGLACGFVLFLAQWLFLARAQIHGIPTGNGLANFMLLAGNMLCCTLEPPSNPMSSTTNLISLIDLEIERRTILGVA